MISPAILVAYYAAWSIYSRSYFVSEIPVDKITHINYAFANIDTDGCITLGDHWADVDKAYPGDTWDQPLRGNFYQLIKLKETHSHLRTLISIGGWTWSGRFSDVALTKESRKKFAQSCVNFIEKYSFDGVDVDWEYPVSGGLPGNARRPQDKENYVLLLKELRRQLDLAGQKKSKTYLLTVATGAGTERIADMDLPGMSAYLDWINIMTYDFHGGWEDKTGHNAPLFKNDNETVSDESPSFIKSKYNCHEAVQGYIAAGVSPSKLVMGLGLYGRGWQGVTNSSQNGFSQSASRQLPTGTWENGVFDYDHLKKSFIPNNKRYWDDQSKVPFLYNQSTGLWISYDDLQSIEIKSNYIKQEKLAGAMFWELSSDRNAELIGTTFHILNNGMKPSADSQPPPSINQTETTTTTTPVNITYSLWEENKDYQVGDRVSYEHRLYTCLVSHRSLAGWTPYLVGALWKLA